jgi:hypothetical protein
LLIDEADAISNSNDRKKIASLMKYLSDNGSAFKVLVVGIAETGEELTAAHPSVQRCLRETRLGRMTYDELWQLLEAGSAKLRLDFDPDVADSIVRLSSGYPHFTHLLALKCAEEAIASGRREIGPADLEAAMRSAERDAEGTLLSAYEDSIRSRTDLYRLILVGAASMEAIEFTSQELRQAAEAYSGQAIANRSFDGALRRLMSVQRPIFRRVARGVYRFDDPRMSGFIRIANGMVDV